MKKCLLISWAALAGAAVILSAARAQTSQPAPTIEGTISQVNPMGLVTVELPQQPDQPAPLADFLVTPAVAVTIDHAKASLQDLAPGMAVRVTPSADDLPPQSIDAFTHIDDDNQAHEVKGAVESVANNEIGVLLDNKNRRSTSLKITRQTQVTVDGSPAAAGDVKYRMYAIVTYVGNDATKIEARTWIDDAKPHNVMGNIASLDSTRIVLRTGRQGEEFDVELPLSPNTAFLSNGAPATLVEVHSGDRVQMTYKQGQVVSVNDQSKSREMP